MTVISGQAIPREGQLQQGCTTHLLEHKEGSLLSVSAHIIGNSFIASVPVEELTEVVIWAIHLKIKS